jgi:tRNA(fMet)-specific endonuclease VapC
MSLYRYLLDTNILSDLIKNPTGSAARKITAPDIEPLCCTSLIVACELRYGTYKKGSARLISRVEQLLQALPVLSLERNIPQHYGEIRTSLEQAGLPIGGNDLLIAAHARSLQLTIVTANLREFSRVPGLVVENWLS